MKYILFPLVLFLLLSSCCRETAPAEESVPNTEFAAQLANPWMDYASLAEAEAACGLTFPMPETIADSYVAEVFRVMNGELLEVRYCDGEFSVTVRMQAGEGLDLSGVYGEFDNVTTIQADGATIIGMTINGGLLQLISKDGYSFSLYAPNHYWGDSNVEFLQYLYNAK